jgi:hypothetical protein
VATESARTAQPRRDGDDRWGYAKLRPIVSETVKEGGGT